MNSNKLQAKDFITVGIFTAILFVVEFAIMMLGYISPFLVAGYCVLMPIILGIPMMLYYTKIEKFGMITLTSILIAILLFITGMGFLGAPIAIVSGLVADFIAKAGKYKSFKMTVLSYAVFSLWVTASYLPLIITRDSYMQSMIDGGYEGDFVDTLFKLVTAQTYPILIILCFVCGIIGAFLGKLIMKKHFEKAGIA